MEAMAPPLGNVRAVVRVRVETDGTAGEVRIREGTGDPEVDGAVMGLAATMHFHPALHGRVPVVVWSQMPLTIHR